MIFFPNCQSHVEKGAMNLKRVAAASCVCVKPISKQFAVDTYLKTIWAEVALVGHNMPLNAVGHAGSLFRVMFPDSKYAKTTDQETT